MDTSVVTTTSESIITDSTISSNEPIIKSNNVDDDVLDTSSSIDNLHESMKEEIANEIVETEHDINPKELTWEQMASEIADHQMSEYVVNDKHPVNNGSTSEPVTSFEHEQLDTTTEEMEIVDHLVTTTTEETSSGAQPVSTSEAVTGESETQSNNQFLNAKVEFMADDNVVEEPPSTAEEGVTISEDSTGSAVINDAGTENAQIVTEPDSSDQVNETIVEEDNMQIVEITEVSSRQVTETEEVAYTVIEAEDEAETNEIIEEHLASQINEETLVFADSDTVVQVETVGKSSEKYVEEIYLIKEGEKGAEPEEAFEEYEEDEEEEEVPQQVKVKKPRGRKPITDIPLHVLGRDISKPKEGVSNGGRILPKPRLGVKVPYRNLTSQIVSKEDIQKEIMDRFKQRQEQVAPSTGNLLFARKLTQRLAKKLTPSEKDGKAGEKKSPPISKQSTSSQKSAPSGNAAPETVSSSAIKDNSDLLAILEGDDIDMESVEKHTESKEFAESEKFVKDIEKEIALKQLKELPIPKNRIFKSRGQTQNPTVKSGIKPEPLKQSSTPKSQETEAASSRTEVASTPKSGKQADASSTTKHKSAEPTSTTKSKSNEPSSTSRTREKKSQPDEEPQLKAGMVIKTYTRKRRSFELDTIMPQSLQEEARQSEVYVTKSSRVIKKKIIWDPDEVPAKPLLKSPKPSEPSPKPKAVERRESEKLSEKKPAEKSVEKKPAEKSVEKKPTEKVAEKKAAEKVPEKKTADKSFEKKVPVPIKKGAAVKGSPVKKPKRLTEIDRLLMDEGAVNMLYDVKNNDDPNQDKSKKKQKSVISLDRAHRELMSRTSVIKNDLQQNTNKESQKSLRKKDGPSPRKDVVPGGILRQKSKDSSKSSVHSPPASPAYSSAEASRIIRRHSSSSFSSDDVEEGEEEGVVEKPAKRKHSSSGDPLRKRVKKSSEGRQSKDASKVNSVKDTRYSTFTITKTNKLVSVELNYTTETKCYLTEEVLKELTSYLKELGEDDECNVVAITSSGGDSFCHGLNYSVLVVEDLNKRKQKATELSLLVKEFLRCLLNFPKVLVAGIQGDCVGLGVTMLPLFDMVIASDTSTFSTPYASLGCVAEAGFLLTVPHLSSHGLASELLYTSQVLKADDAFRRGLVTRLCWPEKYHEELKLILAGISDQSRQSIEATKVQLRQHILQSTETSLNLTAKVLVEHWTSAECQESFSKYKCKEDVD